MTTNQKIHKALGLCWHEGLELVTKPINKTGTVEFYACTKCGLPADEMVPNPEYDTSLDLLYDAAEKLEITNIKIVKMENALNGWLVVYISNIVKYLSFDMNNIKPTPQLALAHALIAWIERRNNDEQLSRR